MIIINLKRNCLLATFFVYKKEGQLKGRALIGGLAVLKLSVALSIANSTQIT